VTILNNVTIGDNVIVGAGCLVHKAVPSNTIVMRKEELIFKQAKQ
jgi:acetyltransferase-like isoleucine patch superfamily enzyme